MHPRFVRSTTDVMKRIATTAVLALVLAGSASVASAGSEEDLFGPRYHSVSVTKDGQPKALVEGTKLRIRFARHGNREDADWHSGCNFFAARIEVGEETIDFGPIVSTDISCDTSSERQDRFFARFFASDPSWTASGREATLANERVVIELRRRAN